MRSQNAPSEPGVCLKGDVITADTNSTRSLPSHIIAVAGGNQPITGKLHYSSPSSVMISSVSQLGRLTISKGIRLRHWNCWLRGKFWTSTSAAITALLSACNANHVALLPVFGLSLVLHVLPDQTTLLLQKKSMFWLVVWFTLNTSIWCIEIISLITLLSSQSLNKGPRGIGDRRGLVFIVFNTFICAVLLEIKFPQSSPIPFHAYISCRLIW